MKKLYIVDMNDNAAIDPNQLTGFGGCVYAHGTLQDRAGYDVVGQLETDKLDQGERIEDVIAVLPDGKEIPATVFIWIATLTYPMEDIETGEVFEFPYATRLLGLLVAKEDTEAMQYAKRKYDEKPDTI